VDETGKILGAQQRAKGTKLHPKWRHVKLTTILLPFCALPLSAGLKISSAYLLLTEEDCSLKFLFRKENVPRVVLTIGPNFECRQITTDLASRSII